MKMRSVLIGSLVAMSLLGGGAAVATDGDETPRGRHVKFMHRGASVEHAAMHNIMAETLSAKTGRSAAEIKAMFEDAPPPEVVQKLGLSEADMKGLFKQSRETLIQRAAAAGLITAEQATELRKAEPKFERHRKGAHGEHAVPPLPDDDES